MVNIKVPVVLPDGKPGVGVDVPITESTERWSEFKLEDGTIFRAKMNVLSVARVDGQFDQVGNPLYTTNMAPTISIIHVAEHLRKKS